MSGKNVPVLVDRGIMYELSSSATFRMRVLCPTTEKEETDQTWPFVVPVPEVPQIVLQVVFVLRSFLFR